MWRIRVIYRYLIAALVVHTMGCGGGVFGTGDGDDGNSFDEGGVIGSGDGSAYKGQALLGPVVDARVDIFDYLDLSVPRCTMTTANSSDLSTAGEFLVPEDCIEDGKLYLVSVSGGFNIDSDQDLQIDVEPTPVNGSFRSLVTAEQIRSTQWKVTAVTELIAQSIQYLRANGLAQDQIADAINLVAAFYVGDDLSLDGQVDGGDASLWSPLENRQSLLTPTLFAKTVEKIQRGSITDEVIDDSIRQLDTLGAARIVRIDNGYAYIVSEATATTSLLDIVDLSAAGDLRVIDSRETGLITDLQITRGIAYLAMGDKGLEVLDYSEPSAPKALASYTQKTDRVLFANEQKNQLIGVAVTEAESQVYLASLEEAGQVSIDQRQTFAGATVVLDVSSDAAIVAVSIADWRDLSSLVCLLKLSVDAYLGEPECARYSGVVISDINIYAETVYWTAVVPEFFPASDDVSSDLGLEESGGLPQDPDNDAVSLEPDDDAGSYQQVVALATGGATGESGIGDEVNMLPGMEVIPPVGDGGNDSASSTPTQAVEAVRTASAEVVGDTIYSYENGSLLLQSALDFSVIARIELPGEFQGPIGPDVDFQIIGDTAYIANRDYGLLLVDLKGFVETVDAK